jgi:hypothetical protein
MSHYMYIAMEKTNSGMVHGLMTCKRVCVSVYVSVRMLRMFGCAFVCECVSACGVLHCV